MTAAAGSPAATFRLPSGVRRNADRACANAMSGSSPSATTASGRAISANFRREFPDRLVNVGIAEQNMVGVAAGLANGGYIPFVCAASPFLTGRALEQIKADIAYSRVSCRAVRHESGHGLWRARSDPPFDRGSELAAGDHRSGPGRAGRSRPDPRGRALGTRLAAYRPSCASAASRCRRLARDRRGRLHFRQPSMSCALARI